MIVRFDPRPEDLQRFVRFSHDWRLVAIGYLNEVPPI